MRVGALLIGLLIIASAHAGVLMITSETPQISVTWLQGVERGPIHFTNREVYRSQMTLLAGPNQCFSIGADGNDRAIFIRSESDSTGPYMPDAVVDCRICGCEDRPGTRFTCLDNGRCQACDPCASAPCAQGEVCIRSTCSESSCACDPILCSGTRCDERVTVTNRCALDRCVEDRACIEGSCGAQCSSGPATSRTFCDGDALMRVTTTCMTSCTPSVRTMIVEDCREHECPLGSVPRCTSGGCRCD